MIPIEINHLIFGALTLISLVVFVIKRSKAELDALKQTIKGLELKCVSHDERLRMLHKLLEDRRRAEINIYERLNGNG